MKLASFRLGLPEENLRLLGDAIGIPLEPVGTKRFVGSFKADLPAREAGTDGYVLIENQLERTNHDHLGKLVTYAARLNAKAVVWVAREIMEGVPILVEIREQPQRHYATITSSALRDALL